jgi:hypothetical protein
MTFVLTAVLQQSDYVIDGARSDDNLRNEAIRAGIRCVADKVDSPVENLVRADQLTQRLAYLPRRTGDQFIGKAIFCRLTRRVTDPSCVWLQ